MSNVLSSNVLGPGAYTQGARVYSSVAISLSNNAFTTLTFNSERFDTDDIHSTTVNTSRLTCKTAGTYAIGGCVDFAVNATGQRGVALNVNGVGTILQDMRDATAVFDTFMPVATVRDLVVGDYVELLAFQNSGAALNAEVAAGTAPTFWMQRVG